MRLFHFRASQKEFLLLAILTTTLSLQSSCSKKSSNPEQTLYLYQPDKIKGIDPAQASDQYSSMEVGKVYEGLLQYHYLKRPYTLEPLLAEALPKISSDRLTYTFQIKKGVLFQDDPAFTSTQGKGRELTAEDFVYSFKRLADPKIQSAGWWIFDGKIVGLNEWRDEAAKSGQTDYTKPVEGLRALDRYSLQIKLKQPSSQMLYYLAMPFAGVVAKEAVEFYKDDFGRNPVGTGPFKMVRSETNYSSKIVWVKNENYRKEFYPSEGESGDEALGLLEDAGKPLPLAEKIVVQVIVERQPQWLNFLAGKLDKSSIPKDNFDQVIGKDKELLPELKQKNIRLLREPSLDITHDTFNMADPILGKNKLLRQALSVVHDPEPVLKLFYNGRAIPAQGPIPPGLSGYNPSFKNPYRQFSVERAKQLLAKAGYPEGKGLAPIEYLVTSSSESRQMAEHLAKQFALIGVQLKITQLSWPEFLAAVKNKKGQMYGYAWGADYPDAENFLQLFYSKNASPGPNDSNYSNPEYDRLYEDSLKLVDGPQRTELYKKMALILAEDCPWIFGVHRITYELVQPWLKNEKIHEFSNNTAKYLRIDPSKKK